MMIGNIHLQRYAMTMAAAVTYVAQGVYGAHTQRAPETLAECLLASVQRDAARARFPEDTKFVENDLHPFNLNFQFVPAAVMYPLNSSEVARVVACTVTHNRKIQARCGGHDYTSKGLGGANGTVVIDVNNLKSVSVDQENHIAAVGSGNRLKDIVDKLHEQGGRYIPHGSSRTVGIGGHGTVGGFGLHTRLNGAAIDVMIEAEVVLGNATVVRASKDQNQDLFWAIRGGGSSFGIVTEFKFATEPEPAEVLDFQYTIASTDPDTLSESFQAYHEITRNPELDRKFSAAAILNNASLLITGAYFGTQADFDKLAIPSRIPHISETSVKPGLTWSQHMESTFDGISQIFPAQAYFYARDTAIPFNKLPSNESVDAAIRHLLTAESAATNWFLLVDLYGGAINDVAVDATAFPHRDLAYFFAPYVITNGTTTEVTFDYVDKAVLEIQNHKPDEFLSYAGYTNVRNTGLSSQAKHWGSNLPRLERIKALVDPDDVFSTPLGIKPRA